MIQIDGFVFLQLALMLLILPLDWLLSAVIASGVHEFCHLAALYPAGGTIERIQIHPGGCVIEASGMTDRWQFISILAGPLGSVSLLFLCRIAPEIAICGFLQGVYNLIPVFPLDGGRMMQLLLYRYCPHYADSIQNTVWIMLTIMFALVAIWLTVTASAGNWLIPLVILCSIRSWKRKIPCKESNMGVQ